MEKITDKIAALPDDANFFSLEFFPPKTDEVPAPLLPALRARPTDCPQGFSNLHARLSRMASALRPLFVTVTWGAGGSTAARSLELAALCHRDLRLTTCLHLTCTNAPRRAVDAALREARRLGIRNVLALRGDPPRGAEYSDDGRGFEGADGLASAVDLVRYIRREHGDWFCVGVAGYPEGHADESHPAHQDPRHDLPYLADKVRAGADFVMTQLFYDEAAFLAYEKLVRAWDGGALQDVPIIPGLMPIQSYKVLKRVTDLSHARLPDPIFARLAPIRGDDEAVREAGYDVLTAVVERIKTAPAAQRRGFHFYTLNLEKTVSFVLERTGLIPPITPDARGSPSPASSSSALALDTPASSAASLPHVRPGGAHDPAHPHPHAHPGRRPSSPHNHMTADLPLRAASPPPPPRLAARATDLAIAHGVGAVGRAATWDDYPNGRFGDARSPAFGEIDGYGPSPRVRPATAAAQWGAPAARADVGALFARHLRGELAQLPWSEGALSDETRAIEPWLVRMVEKGWWSVASQPAVDGARSDDRVFGWGPPGGFVFQKPFVEFWIPGADWRERLRPRLEKEADAGRASWYATPNPLPPSPAASTDDGPAGAAPPDGPPTSEVAPDATKAVADALFDADAASRAPDAAHSVTWGAFPGKEIATPTIIEAMSFRAWADEAFDVWRQWARCYPPGSRAREVIGDCAEELWLVNVIGHAYRERDGLWEMLVEA